MLRIAVLSLFALSLSFAGEDWGPAQFLVGKWTGEGGGATGAFSFTPDLQGTVLVRKSFAAYPLANGKPAYRHDDLMIVYREAASRPLLAIYFDNEGHVIRYSVKPAEGGVVFTSEGAQDTTRFRLTYTSSGPETVKLKFEIAPPGGEFRTYIESTARRER